MNDTGLVAAFTGVRKPFQLREFPGHAAGTGDDPGRSPDGQRLRQRLAHLAGRVRRLARVSRSRFACRSATKWSGGSPALGEGVTRDWAGAAAARSATAWHTSISVPAANVEAAAKGSTPRCRQGQRYRLPPTESATLQRRLRTVLLRAPAAGRLQSAGQRARRAGRAGQLCLVAGDRRTGAGRRGTRAIRSSFKEPAALGINAVAVAKERGVTQVIVIDGIESRLELATEFGADVTIDLNEFKTPAARVARVRELTDGEGADAVMELVGSPAVVAEGIEMLCSGGSRIWKSATSTRG